LEWHNGDWKAAQGGYSHQKDDEGIEEETHAARASAVHHRWLGARTRAGSSGGASNRQRARSQSRTGTRGLETRAITTVRYRVAITPARPPWAM